MPTVPATSGSNLETQPDLGKDFINERIITRGSGDTSNTTFTASTQVFDAETGDNITNAYSTYIGLGTMTFLYNGRYSSTSLIGGNTVGTIEDFALDFNNGNLIPPINATTVAAGDYTQAELNALNAISSGRTKFIHKNTFVSLNTQTNPSNPASTGTLEGVQSEIIISTSTTAQNTSNNNSSFADITFLATSGNLYEEPSSGTFLSLIHI